MPQEIIEVHHPEGLHTRHARTTCATRRDAPAGSWRASQGSKRDAGACECWHHAVHLWARIAAYATAGSEHNR